MKVFIVQGEHPYIPGFPISVWSTRYLAMIKAVELLNICRHSLDMKPDATVENFEVGLRGMRRKSDLRECIADVWIDELELDRAS